MEDSIAANVVANVRRIVEARDLDFKTLAKKMKITPASLSAMISAHKSISSESISRLSVALDVDPCELISPPAAKKQPRKKKPTDGRNDQQQN